MRSSAKSPDVIGPLERTQKRADCRHMGRHQESFCDHASETMSLDPAVGGPQRLIAWFRTQRSWAGWCSYIARSLGIRNKRVERCCPIIALNRLASYMAKCTVLLCLAASTPWCGQLLTWCSSPLFFLETALNSDCRGDRAAWRHQCVSRNSSDGTDDSLIPVRMLKHLRSLVPIGVLIVQWRFDAFFPVKSPR